VLGQDLGLVGDNDAIGSMASEEVGDERLAIPARGQGPLGKIRESCGLRDDDPRQAHYGGVRGPTHRRIGDGAKCSLEIVEVEK
jgi:hypothetical protein